MTSTKIIVFFFMYIARGAEVFIVIHQDIALKRQVNIF